MFNSIRFYKPSLMEMPQSNNRGNPIQNSNGQINVIQMSKKDLKSKISSRQDFVLLFGFERKFNSRILFTAKKIHHLAVHHAGFRR